MLSSKYADPQVTNSDSNTPNGPRSSFDLGPGRDLMSSRFAQDQSSPTTSNQASPNTLACRDESELKSSMQASDVSDHQASNYEPIDSRLSNSGELASSATKSGYNDPDTTKQLPPIPHDAEPSKHPNTETGPLATKTSQAAEQQTTDFHAANSVSKTQTDTRASIESARAAEMTSTKATEVKAQRSRGGRLCQVKLPNDKSKTYSGYPLPMSKAELNARLHKLESEGYNVREFGFGKSAGAPIESDSLSQSRREYPDSPRGEEERSKSNFTVSIPDKKQWNEYVKFLTEERLRALGVTSGEGDEERTSLHSTRHGSSPFMIPPTSPPVPPSSSASQHMWQTSMPFSAPFSSAPSTNNTSIGAVVSPPPQFGPQGYATHIPRQSTFGFASPSGQTPPSFQQYYWPTQQMVGSNASIGRASPALPSVVRRQSGLSHGSPDLPDARQSTPRNNSAPRANSASYWRSNIVPEQARTTGEEVEFKQSSRIDSHIHVASPKPRGHRHNISANLEREAENAQYYPGEYVNENAQDPHSGTAKALEDSNLDTAIGNPDRKAENFDKPLFTPAHRSIASHHSNISTSSKLNVAAKEFKFDPEASSNRNFSMPHDVFMPSPSKAAKAADATSSVQFATAHSHQGSVSLSNLNVAAPEFNPPSQKNFAFSSSWFNFSARKPSEAAKAAAESNKDIEDKERSSTIGSKIFGNLADIVKPSKKSKAVPIVNPSEVLDTKDDESEVEDEDGRIVRSDSRRKKSRFMDDDGDEIPRFAEPSSEPSLEPLSEPHAEPSVQDVLPEHQYKSPLMASNLPDDPDMTGTLSDGSNVPWHELSSDLPPGTRDTTPSAAPRDTISSPIPASGFEELHEKQIATLSQQSPEVQDDYSGSVSEKLDGSILYPSFQEIDDVMDYINKENSDFGVEDDRLSEPREDLIPNSLHVRNPTLQGHFTKKSASLEPSTDENIQGQDENDRSLRDPHQASEHRNSISPVRKLNTMAEAAVSDWDDMLQPGEELKIPQQSHLSDAHVISLVEDLLRKYLSPFEQQMKDISASIKKPSAREFGGLRPVSAYEKSDSDADDEDDSGTPSRVPSRDIRSDKRLEQIKSAVMEAMLTSQSDGIGQIEQEIQFRKAAENRADDLQRQLMLAHNENTAFKENSRLSDERIQRLEHERDEISRRHKAVEEELRTKTLNFTTEIASLESTVDEHRTSSMQWQENIESVRKEADTLGKTVEKMKSETAANERERSQMSEKINELQKKILESSNQHAAERSIWEINRDKQTRDIENLQVKSNNATEHQKKLEGEISRLSEIEKNSIKTSVMLEETQNAKRKLEVMVNKLNEKTIEHQTIVARYEREASEAHENTTVQVERTKALLKTDIEVANKKVENVRADLETRLEMTKSELENVRKDHDAVRSRYERSLNEASLARKEALQEANNNHTTRLEEERSRFTRSLQDLSSQHDRAMRNAIEDKQRSETHQDNSLKLANDKIAYLEEIRESLEEKVSVAQSAAQAAAIAAQSAKQPQSSATPELKGASVRTPAHLEKISPQALRESVVVLQEQLQERESRIEQLEAEISSVGRDAPEKLRERETEINWLREVLGVRVDDLSDLVNNLQLEKFDRGAARNAAIRIKANLEMEQQEKDRALQGGKPSASQTASLPGLNEIQNFASPKAAQFTSAFNNWRKSGPSSTFASIKDAINSGPPSRPPPPSRNVNMAARVSASAASANSEQEESSGLKNATASAAAANASKSNRTFQTGLMTPPASNLRRTPSTGTESVSVKDAPQNTTPAEAVEPRTPSRGRPNLEQSNATSFHRSPTTPELMRKRDYDLDAELGDAALDFEGFVETDNDHTEATVEQTKLEPLGEVVASPGKS